MTVAQFTLASPASTAVGLTQAGADFGQFLDIEVQRRYHAFTMQQQVRFFGFYFYFTGPLQPLTAEEVRLP